MQLTISPIGYIATPFDERYRAPRQPGVAEQPAEGVITLAAGMNFEQALEDLEGFDRIWVIFWFDRNTGWRPKVQPPRGPLKRRGVFATRSPHRPNPIGLSLLRLLEVRGRQLRVGDVDLLDGTPILDIKPYLPYAEAFPNSEAGWLDEIPAPGHTQESEPYVVRWSSRATLQHEWLAAGYGIDLASVADAVLRHDPHPHPYRRTSLRDDGFGELAIKSWRVLYNVVEGTVVIERLESGYAAEVVASAAAGTLHDQDAHKAWHAARL